MTSRYGEKIPLMNDIGLLNPIRFDDINQNGLPLNACNLLTEYISRFDECISTPKLRLELQNLASNWNGLKNAFSNAFDIYERSEEGDTKTFCKSCKACTNCVFFYLTEYNLISETYPALSIAYKFILTLSFTQVGCERSFSTLKMIKNRLRSTMTQEHLQTFMLMHNNKDVLVNLDNEDIIDKMAESSDLMKTLLIN